MYRGEPPRGSVEAQSGPKKVADLLAVLGGIVVCVITVHLVHADAYCYGL